jgi:hypothetical protein
MGGNFCPTEVMDEKQHRRLIAEAANAALRGETHNTGQFTAPPGAASYTLQHSRLGVGKVLLLVPTNAAAAISLWHVSKILKGTAVINFSNPPTSDAAFDFVIIGAGA